MNSRLVASLGLIAVALLLGWGTVTARTRIHLLKTEQSALLGAVSRTEISRESVESSSKSSQPAETSPEVLRLRNEISQLGSRRAELTAAKAENERLRTQLDSGVSGKGNPFSSIPGYVRGNQAQRLGYSTPEDTLQTMLWSLQQRDLANFLQAFTPDIAERLKKLFSGENGANEEFEKGARAFVGFAIVAKESKPDGSVELQTKILPDMPAVPMRLELINGEWKIATQ